MKPLTLAFVMLFSLMHSHLAWSETKVFHLSVTIPASVSLNNNLQPKQQPNQTTQTDQLIRNNKTVMITSIVAP